MGFPPQYAEGLVRGSNLVNIFRSIATSRSIRSSTKKSSRRKARIWKSAGNSSRSIKRNLRRPASRSKSKPNRKLKNPKTRRKSRNHSRQQSPSQWPSPRPSPTLSPRSSTLHCHWLTRSRSKLTRKSELTMAQLPKSTTGLKASRMLTSSLSYRKGQLPSS